MTYENTPSPSEYNGWTNYETWRVNLEFFDEYDFENESQDGLRFYVYDHIVESTKPGVARDLALAFIGEVNWCEILVIHQATETLERKRTS